MAQKETAAPAGTGHGGKEKFHTNNANPAGAKKQGTSRYFLNGRGGGHG